MSRGFSASLVAFAIVAAAALYGVAWWDGQKGAAEAEHQAQVDQVLRTAKPHHARNDSLRAARVALQVAARAATAQDVSLQAFTDSVRASLQRLPEDTVVPVRLVRRMLEVYEARIAHLRSGVVLLDSALTFETTRADSAELRVYRLEELLRTKPPQCRILFVPCPSRTSSFIAGAAAATILFVIAREP